MKDKIIKLLVVMVLGALLYFGLCIAQVYMTLTFK